VSVRHPEIIAAGATLVIRLLLMTVRTKLVDRAGVKTEWPSRPLIAMFWHNRLLVMPEFFRRHFPERRAAALTSASKDGAVLAAILRRFGIRPIRGSSSRRGGAALIEMKRASDDGFVVVITPDGPRGPRYRLSPGVVKLAQLTGSLVVPIDVQYSRCWQLKSWDGFMIPKPFACATITLGELQEVRADGEDEAFESERSRLERVLRDHGASEPVAPEG
jgi:hypothetical protein